MHAEGLDPDWYVTRHRTRDEVLPWDHIAAGLHHDFLWDDWQAALAEHGLPDCRWTPCYDCGVCTDYALEHVVASPLAPAGGSQGTGQDLSGRAPTYRCGSWARSRAATVAQCRHEGRRARIPVRLRYTKRGKVRWISHRDVARALERAFRITQLPLAFTEGFSPRPKVSFGLALSTGHESDAEYLDLVFADEVELEALLGVAHRGAARRHGGHRRGAARRAGAGVARSGDRGRVAGRARRAPTAHRSTRRSSREHVDRALELPALPTTQAAQGPRGRGGRAARSSGTVRRLRATNPVSVEMELITQPRSAKPGEVLAGIARATDFRADWSRHRYCEPTNGSSATARGWNRSTPTRARVRWRRARHERRHRCPNWNAPSTGAHRPNHPRCCRRTAAPQRRSGRSRRPRTHRAPSRRRSRAPRTDAGATGTDRERRREAPARGARRRSRKKRRRRGSRGGRGRKKPRRGRRSRRRRRRATIDDDADDRSSGSEDWTAAERRSRPDRRRHRRAGPRRRRARRAPARAARPKIGDRRPAPSRAEAARRRQPTGAPPRAAAAAPGRPTDAPKKRRRRRGGRGRSKGGGGGERTERRRRARERSRRAAAPRRPRPCSYVDAGASSATSTSTAPRCSTRSTARRSRAGGGTHRKGRPGRSLPDGRAPARRRHRAHRACSKAARSSSTTCRRRPTTHSSIDGNIYLGRVQNVLPGHGSRVHRHRHAQERRAVPRRRRRTTRPTSKAASSPRIESVLRNGQSIIVQVTKNPIAHKGARLTQEVSLAGRFVVMVPGQPQTYGISKRLPDDERKRLRRVLDRLRPADAGLIVRTAAEGATEEELERDMLRLNEQWRRSPSSPRRRSPAACSTRSRRSRPG